jgi:hypothetical protein
MSPIDFISTRNALDGLAAVSSAEGRPFVTEARNKLGQLHWLCERIAHVETVVSATDWRACLDTRRDLPPSLIELQTLTESFYYLSWRLISLLDRKDSPIPALRGLRSRCRGIRLVRNQLLEHPEAADSGVHVPAMMFGTSDGPRLKFVAEIKQGESGNIVFQTNAQNLLDAGLWSNALELKKAIESKALHGSAG